jgi:DNA-binding HxlR family transcriptional regulator
MTSLPTRTRLDGDRARLAGPAQQEGRGDQPLGARHRAPVVPQVVRITRAGAAAQPPGPSRTPESLEALTRALALLGIRGTGLVITALTQGPADLPLMRERVPGLSDGLLTRRLREMTALGLVERTAYPGTARHTVYALASHGKALVIPLVALTVWAQDHLPAHTRAAGPRTSPESGAPHGTKDGA